MTGRKERGQSKFKRKEYRQQEEKYWKRSKREKIIGRKREGRKKWKDLSKKDPQIPTMMLGLSSHFLAPEP